MFHFTGQFDNNTATFTASVEMNRYAAPTDNAFHAALEAGRIIRAEAKTQGITGRLVLKRAAAPVAIVADEFAATREAGRKAGLTEEQIESFITRQAA